MADFSGKRLIAGAFALALTLTFALSAIAKDDRSQFIIFDVTVVDGKLQVPTGILIDGRDKVRFKRLLVLKKSFSDQFDTAHLSPILK